jgi:isopentenyl-diphosphate delta-isomerase
MTDEILDLVDTDDNVIGTMERSKVYETGLNNFRVINAFIINDKGKLWIPRRTAWKRLFPLCLDVSIGGHVSSGESYEEAFLREAEEEIGLRLHESDYREIARLTPEAHGVSAYMRVYEIRMNEVPGYNKRDFSEYYWLSPVQVLARIEKGEKAKDDLTKLIKHIYIR